MGNTQTETHETPLGVVTLTVADGKLFGVRLEPETATSTDSVESEQSRFGRALRDYLAGRDPDIEADNLDLSAVTEFQREVLLELLRVPFGEVVTYGELARRICRPDAARAVGQAVGGNPLPVFIPCHRVVATGLQLGGFGAGLRWKRALLRHEGWQIEEGVLMSDAQRRGAKRVCVYAGSFDPPTNGHMYMITQGARLFDRLIVAVGINPNKTYTFTVEERLEMLRQCVVGLDNVKVESFEGKFLVRYAESVQAGYVLRGIRSLEDYRFEHAMRNVNEDLAPGIATVFLMPPREICEISSSFVKGLIGFEGWKEAIEPYVPAPVYEKLLVSKVRYSHRGHGAEGGAD